MLNSAAVLVTFTFAPYCLGCLYLQIHLSLPAWVTLGHILMSLGVVQQHSPEEMVYMALELLAAPCDKCPVLPANSSPDPGSGSCDSPCQRGGGESEKYLRQLVSASDKSSHGSAGCALHRAPRQGALGGDTTWSMLSIC